MTGFSHPLVFTALVMVPLLGAYVWYFEEHSRRRALAFSTLAAVAAAQAAEAEERHPLRRFFTPKRTVCALLLLTLSLLVIGLAGPHIPLENEKEGVNVVLAMDVSGSMQATDYAPTRLAVAQDSARLLLDRLGEKDFAGIVTFDSGAASAAYLSPDTEKVKRKLAAITSRGGNTAIGDGLALATDMADAIPDRQKVVVLLSDGENNAGTITPEEAVSFAQARQVQVFTIGLGSPEPVVYDYDAFGNPLYAALDEDVLTDIAEKTGGTYFHSVDAGTLEEIYAGLNAVIVRETEETDISWAFFTAAIFTLVAAVLVAFGRRQTVP